MAQKYVVVVDDVEIQTFETFKDANDFRMSVSGTIKNVKIKPNEDISKLVKSVTQTGQARGQ